MFVKQSDYETLLSNYSSREGAIALLRQYRLYLEMLPSVRRPQASIIPIPLPIAKVRSPQRQLEKASASDEAVCLPCDLAILLCDPEWKIKLGVEILVFIHRPQEDFSALLRRWRETQVYLDREYQWFMPLPEQHMFSETAEKIYPLFVVFEATPERIKQGLTGAGLPYVVHSSEPVDDREPSELQTRG
ncbi:MAG: hypothetical protein ACFB4I_08250 [Cyanophyceae cyanobacterium]